MSTPDVTAVPAARIREKVVALRARAEQIRTAAEREITALLTAANELEALLAPATEAQP
jgi:hypothetical protein